MAKTVLVVDDEPKIRKMITKYLTTCHYLYYEAENGKEALEVLENETVDLIILDLMMPIMDGESFIKKAREFSDVYIIALTAKTGEDSQVVVYGLGADDYIEKPFSCKVLMSKIQAVFSRLDQKTYGKQLIAINELQCDSTARKAFINGADCALKPKEFELLQFLLHNQNVALTREQLLSGVWGDDYFGSDRTVDIHISNLRKKLGKYGQLIKTLTGHGYRFEVQNET